MQVLILNHEFPPLGGGVGITTYNVARELVKMGHKVDVLTSRYKDLKKEEIIEGIQVYRVKSFRKNILTNTLIGMLAFVIFGIIRYRKLCKQKKYRVVHFFFSVPSGIISLFTPKRQRFSIVVSLQGSDVPGYDPYTFRFLHWLFKPLNKMVWHKADILFALSHGLKRIAQKTDKNVRIEVIHNGVDSNIFRVLDKKKPATSKIRLICVARLIKRKGIQYLLYALSNIKRNNIELMIVGTGDYEEQLRQLVKKLNLSQIVTFYGYCPNEGLCRLYNDSDIFALPSLTESFGIVFAEAMACGLPIIGTRVGGIPEFVRDQVDGFLVPPGDIESLRQALTNLIDNPQLRQEMGKNGAVRIRREFTWKNIAEQYLAGYYENIVRI